MPVIAMLAFVDHATGSAFRRRLRMAYFLERLLAFTLAFEGKPDGGLHIAHPYEISDLRLIVNPTLIN